MGGETFRSFSSDSVIPPGQRAILSVLGAGI
jgi:hypothetical protein